MNDKYRFPGVPARSVLFCLVGQGCRLRRGDKGSLDDDFGLLTWHVEWNCRLRCGDKGSLDDDLGLLAWHVERIKEKR